MGEGSEPRGSLTEKQMVGNYLGTGESKGV